MWLLRYELDKANPSLVANPSSFGGNSYGKSDCRCKLGR